MKVRDYLAAPTRLTKSAQPADASSIHDVAAATGYVPGPVLRAILSKENGGRARAGILTLPDGSNTAMQDVLSTTQIIETWRNVADDFGNPTEYIPIMRDGFGNLLVLNRAETLLFYNHDTGALVDLHLSLEEYPSALRSPPPDPPPDLAKFYPLAMPTFQNIAGGMSLVDAFRPLASDPATLGQFLRMSVSLRRPEWIVALLSDESRRTMCPPTEVGAALCRAAASEEALPLLDALLRGGADINQGDPRGWTALMHAARHNVPEVVRWLLDHGADPSRTNFRGFNAKREALAEKRVENAALLPD
jgi:hypothetical protein